MTKEAAELLSNYGGEIRENYSGRSMFGSTTCGIVFDDEGAFFKAIGTFIQDINREENINNRHHVTKALRQLKTDNMGRSIIYY